jgi:methylmalonyl-CoA/ethylmalonyl-CoA epimerase
VTVEGYGLHFHHFGLAVRKMASTLAVLRGLGYQCDEPVYDELQEVNLVWCEHDDMPAVELVSPTGAPGPVDKILEQSAESVYHLCFSSDSIERSLAAMKDDGIRVIPVVDTKPAVLFQNRLVGFYQVKGLGLIEIVENS